MAATLNLLGLLIYPISLLFSLCMASVVEGVTVYPNSTNPFSDSAACGIGRTRGSGQSCSLGLFGIWEQNVNGLLHFH